MSWVPRGLVIPNLDLVNLSHKLKPLKSPGVIWMIIIPTFLISCWRQSFREQTRASGSHWVPGWMKTKLCSPYEINRNSELRMAKPASQQGDRQMAKGSCLDDKGRKNKMQKKTRTLSSKSWGTPSAARHFPAGEGSSSRTRGQEEAFSPGHPAATRRPVGVDATGPDAGNGGHRMQCPGPCGCQGLP